MKASSPVFKYVSDWTLRNRLSAVREMEAIRMARVIGGRFIRAILSVKGYDDMETFLEA